MTTDGMVKVAVCGAHMSGLPLNGQLIVLGGKLLKQTTTTPHYRLYQLQDFVPPRPGLVRMAEGGAKIEVEVWELPLRHYGTFVAAIPAPLGIGTLELVDHESVQGFLCEAYATTQALDISAYGGWRNYVTSIS
ncbi:MAG TPA: amidase [Novimethylophilus sp.]|uniref:allophanate hydrolase-related protein n=1 Tax=Novimethylophilus sp. TaxID=2137426 RepID=UPI002F40A049